MDRVALISPEPDRHDLCAALASGFGNRVNGNTGCG
jgi:hypothetical protein